ncbi:hypothetical protein VIGAN_07105900 [Vigna angularis var. angularis]|uniref:Uncharacterized protein n=1 Tax=Vigna angularis var. angularis TaxID=157739 RepID=A0A0S3SHU3_PHAAN|nr:hypothetical protein VIGAN_07105900 [Vigna angularis var. angularis]
MCYMQQLMAMAAAWNGSRVHLGWKEALLAIRRLEQLPPKEETIFHTSSIGGSLREKKERKPNHFWMEGGDHVDGEEAHGQLGEEMEITAHGDWVKE